VAVIDVGSRAVRLAIGELAPSRPVRRLELLDAPVAIGLDTFGSGRIRFATTEAVVSTLNDFLGIARGYGIEASTIRAVATTAVRDARNRDVFLDRVEKGCGGLRIEVIEAIEETRLIYQFVRQLVGPRFDQGTCMVLSLGAGGTQIILQRDGEIVFGETRHFGLLQLWSRRPTERAAILAARRFLDKEVRAIQRIQDLAEASSLFVINKELYLLLEALAEIAPSPVGIELHRDELERLHGELDEVPSDDLLTRVELDYSTIEMGRMALEELEAFTGFTSARTITVPGASMIDSLLLDARVKLEGAGQQARRVEQVESAASALGTRYHYDEDHALQVRALALQLFDALGELHHLAPRSRIFLSVAALLHDIGYFVSFHRHELHSRYLIAASEIMGLTRNELERIAIVARYHKGVYADIHCPELQIWPPGDRVELLKLSALLRLADALDDDNLQRVERVRVEWSPDLLRIYAETRGGDRESFANTAQTFRAKADLFGEIFGIEPTLTEVLAL
jgi:exopolyphosphatase/guanosine-5'-triphosphate,3'-diphosphate pyrophosphatase